MMRRVYGCAMCTMAQKVRFISIVENNVSVLEGEQLPCHVGLQAKQSTALYINHYDNHSWGISHQHDSKGHSGSEPVSLAAPSCTPFL